MDLGFVAMAMRTDFNLRSLSWAIRRTFAGIVVLGTLCWQSAQAAPRPIIYQLVVRHFGNENGRNVPNGTISENGVGKFSDINDAALREIKKLNVTHIWLTGVLRQSTLTDYSALGITPDDPDAVKGRAGSFFAIRDLFDVSPDYADNPAARREEFAALVKRIHSHDMKVLIDLVGNHVARSYESVVRPDLQLGKLDDQEVSIRLENNFVYLPWFQQGQLELPKESNQPVAQRDGLFPLENGQPGNFVKATGNRLLSRTPGTDSWYETVLLNYGFDFVHGKNLYDAGAPKPINSTWSIMDEFVRTWSMDYGVDGFRADFAHWVPTDYWSWLIANARKRKSDMLFVAEAYENKSGLIDAGFDAVYDDPTYDLLKAVTNRTVTPGAVEGHWFDESANSGKDALRYVENHDERRIASPVVFGSGPDQSGFGSAEMGRLVAPLAYLGGAGPILIYNGQTEGEKGEGREGFDGENGRTTIFDYWTVPALSAWRNGGRYDGGRLSQEQRSLQDFYRSLTNLVQSPVFQTGAYYGLNFVNRLNGRFPLDSTLAFARYISKSGELWLVVGNWSEMETEISINIPRDLREAAGLLPGSGLIVESVDLSRGSSRPRLNSRGDMEESVTIRIGASQTRVFRLSSFRN
jgi:glycosidase